MTSLIYRNEVYTVKESGRWVALHYEFVYPGANYRVILGKVSGWRKNLFLSSLSRFKANREEWEFVPAIRMRLYINTLPSVRNQFDAQKIAGVLERMPFEELSFWNWKFSAMRKDAVRGFKAMYRGR